MAPTPAPPAHRASPERRPPAAAGTQRRAMPADLQRRLGNRGVSAALRQRAAAQPIAVQRDPIQTSGASHLPPSVEQAIEGGGGERLPDANRAHMESVLGADLSGVRIHRDPDAAHAANDINARAFTIGQDIYFGARQYDQAPHRAIVSSPMN